MPAKADFTLPNGVNLDEAAPMMDYQQTKDSTKHGSNASRGAHKVDDDDDDDDQYVDDDDPEMEDDGHPQVHSCQTN